MKLLSTNIKDIKKVKTKIFKDKRGFFKEIYKNKILKKKFIFDVMSYSKKGILRGLHIQTKFPQAKLITVTSGKIMDIAVDLRKNSKSFGKYYSTIISQDSDFSLFIPEGFAHDFLCLSQTCTIIYKCSEYRNKKSEKTLRWDDEQVNIKWPVKKPILSSKDKNGKNLDFFK